MPSCKKATAKDPLKFIMSIRNAFAASARSGPSRRGRFHGHNPANARHHEESARAARSRDDGHCSWHSDARWPVKWQCLPGIRGWRNSSHSICAVIVAACSAQRTEKTARRLALFSFGSFGSVAPSLCRLSGKPSRRIGSSRVPSLLGARTIPEAAALRAPRAADSESSWALLSSTIKPPRKPKSRSLTPQEARGFGMTGLGGCALKTGCQQSLIILAGFLVPLLSLEPLFRSQCRAADAPLRNLRRRE